jgi:hypothetical protein
MEDLPHVDWATLLLGLLLGIPVAYVIGILTHMHGIRLERFLENRDLLKKRKTREQALVAFNRIKAFREGKRDKYPFYMILAGVAVTLAITASTFVLIAVIVSVSLELRLILLLLGLLAALIAIILLAGIYETDRQITRFDDYKTEFEQRWGPIDNKHP